MNTIFLLRKKQSNGQNILSMPLYAEFTNSLDYYTYGSKQTFTPTGQDYTFTEYTDSIESQVYSVLDNNGNLIDIRSNVPCVMLNTTQGNTCFSHTFDTPLTEYTIACYFAINKSGTATNKVIFGINDNNTGLIWDNDDEYLKFYYNGKSVYMFDSREFNSSITNWNFIRLHFTNSGISYRLHNMQDDVAINISNYNPISLSTLYIAGYPGKTNSYMKGALYELKVLNE